MEPEERITIAQFIAVNPLTMTATRIPKRSDVDNQAWGSDARHWECELTCDWRTMIVEFSQGSAHTEPPTLAEILDCVASDAAGIENASSFEDWAADYGYDTDSRTAERTYNACKREAANLSELLGPERYPELLWNVDRE